MKTKVLLVDDHPAIRVGVHDICELSHDIEVVGETGNGTSAIKMARQHQPDVVLLDCQLPDLDGAHVARRIQREAPHARILVMSAHNDQGYIHPMLEAGVAGYLLKTEPLDRVVEAIRAVARGQTWFSQRVVAEITGISNTGFAKGSTVEELTDRERDVLKLVADFKTNAEIGRTLCISRKTVEYHIRNIMGKLQVESRRDAARWAKDHGF